MFDPLLNFYPEQVISKYQQRLQEADRARLAALAGAQRVTLKRRLTVWLGDWLIYTGLNLKRRYQAHSEQTFLTGIHFESHTQY
jgi:hypothetical protein